MLLYVWNNFVNTSSPKREAHGYIAIRMLKEHVQHTMKT
jgi:hypothetical protein